VQRSLIFQVPSEENRNERNTTIDRARGIYGPVPCSCSASGAYAQAAAPAAGGQDQAAGKQQYTMAEYNSYKACADDRVPASQVKCFDDFVSKYPNSFLLIYVYPAYIQAYGAQKNYPKLIESADKLTALGDKAEALVRLQGLYARASSYLALSPADQTRRQKPSAMPLPLASSCLTK